MNCDRVFFVLTRGPFPTGDYPADQAVEAHLLICPECRRLAEALRPAVELSRETVTLEESRQLPGYSGQLQQSVVDQAISCLEPQHGEPHPSVAPQNSVAPPGFVASRRRAGLKFWRFAAAVALGSALGAVLRHWDAAAGLPAVGGAAHRPAAVAPPGAAR